MEIHDEAEVCELVGLYLLGKLAPLIGIKNVGLYRDDGLAVIHQANGPKMKRIRKDIIALLKSEGLSITIDKLDRSRRIFSLYEAEQHPSTSILSQTNHLPSSSNCHR